VFGLSPPSRKRKAILEPKKEIKREKKKTKTLRLKSP